VAPDLVVSRDSGLYRALNQAARDYRCVFFAGLSGVGKSLMLQQLALIATEQGRSVHSIQWDVSRAPFDRADILARYPEVDGITHPAIRKAVGLWARDAIERWDHRNPESHHMLVGETPLIGARLIELVRKEPDSVEKLLAGVQTVFLIPSPSLEVRRTIAASRRRDMEAPSNDRETFSAAPTLLDAHWHEIEEVATQLGIPGAHSADGYDPDVYAQVYQRVLHHRRTVVLPVLTVLPVSTSAHDLGVITAELIPTQDEVDRTMSVVNASTAVSLQSEADTWFRT
jgi:hypothetical protein